MRAKLNSFFWPLLRVPTNLINLKAIIGEIFNACSCSGVNWVILRISIHSWAAQTGYSYLQNFIDTLQFQRIDVEWKIKKKHFIHLFSTYLWIGFITVRTNWIHICVSAWFWFTFIFCCFFFRCFFICCTITSVFTTSFFLFHFLKN